MAKGVKIDRVLDLSGLLCPNPGLITAKRLEGMAPGEVIEVICNDRGAEKSIPALCQDPDYRLVESREEQGRFIFVIGKAGNKVPGN